MTTELRRGMYISRRFAQNHVGRGKRHHLRPFRRPPLGIAEENLCRQRFSGKEGTHEFDRLGFRDEDACALFNVPRFQSYFRAQVRGFDSVYARFEKESHSALHTNSAWDLLQTVASINGIATRLLNRSSAKIGPTPKPRARKLGLG